MILSNIVWRPLLEQEAWITWPPEVPSNLSHSNLFLCVLCSKALSFPSNVHSSISVNHNESQNTAPGHICSQTARKINYFLRVTGVFLGQFAGIICNNAEHHCIPLPLFLLKQWLLLTVSRANIIIIIQNHILCHGNRELNIIVPLFSPMNWLTALIAALIMSLAELQLN